MLVSGVTHTCDAFVLREVGRLCNYNKAMVDRAQFALRAHLRNGSDQEDERLVRMYTLSERFNIVSVRALEFITANHLDGVSDAYCHKLLEKIDLMLVHKPFPTKDIHDGFGSSPDNVWYVQAHYNQVCADLYMSTWLERVMHELTGVKREFLTPDPKVYQQILQADYALC